MTRSRRDAVSLAVGVVALVVLLAAWWVAGSGDGQDGAAGTSAGPSATASATRSSGAGPSAAVPPARDTGLPVVRVGDLPPEARETLALIEAGGPFPYDRDGATFGNRERLLPRHPGGWYREYTVPTPGEGDRGARRLVTGRDGTVYWTADHYGSFSVVQEEP